MATLWLILLALFVVFFVYLTKELIKRKREFEVNVKALKNVPQLPRHWFFGNIKDINLRWSDFVFKMQELFIDKGEKMYCFWIFDLPVVMVAHPDTVRNILRSSEPKDHSMLGYRTVIPWLGHSVLISNGVKWAHQRRLLTPAFHFDTLKPYMKIFNQVADTLIEKMAKNSKESKSFEIFEVVGLATLDSLLQCSMSYKGNVQQLGKIHPYVMAVRKLTQLMVVRTLKPHHFPDFIYKWTSDGREFHKHCNYVHEFSAKIIAERRKTLNKNPDVLKKRHLDCLDILLTAKDTDGVGLFDEEIRAEVDTFMFAGHETTATVLSWSLYALGKYPELQTKVYDEVRNAMGGSATVEWEDIPKLKYLACFIKEVMRLYTTVPVAARKLTKQLDVDGVTIPKGTTVHLGLYHLHHHPDIWTNQWEFKPERFESEDIVNKDPYSFVPFSAGPRNCIGQIFAQNEDKVLLARIINRFEVVVDLSKKVEPYIEGVLRTKNGIYIQLKDRKIEQS